MSMTIIYFVHGTTTDNEVGMATGWSPGELSELGRQQATRLGEQVVVDFDVMISSDLKRAVDSASLGFAGKCRLEQDARLRECNYGDLTGGDEKVVKQNMLRCVDKAFLKGESYRDVEQRMRELLSDLAKDPPYF